MSKLKIVPELFLEVAELNRMIRFLDDDGFRKALLGNTLDYGIVYNSKTDFNNFKIEAGSTSGTTKISDGFAIDNAGEFLVLKGFDNMAIPNDGKWYWAWATYSENNIEDGTISIDINGNLIGTGTFFTQILRGQPNFPSRISFPNSVNNTLEYDVVEVINDTTAVLQGQFNNESNLTYSVVGTFTPGYVVPSGDKYIFQYDACTLHLTVETTVNTPPIVASSPQPFFLARIRNVGGTVEVQDKRTAIWKTKADFDLIDYLTSINPLISVEAIRWDTVMSPRNENIVDIAWGFRSTNWTINPTLRTVTILAGNGGKYVDTTHFVNNDFNGWRLYFDDGTYVKVFTSTKSGTQINLVVDILNPDKFVAGHQLLVVPNAEEIEIFANPNNGTQFEINKVKVVFPINVPLAKIPLKLYDSGGIQNNQYGFSYRYKNWKTYTKSNSFPLNNFYYNETQFDARGNLISSPTLSSNGSATFVLQPHPQDFYNLISNNFLGDLYGVEDALLDATHPVLNLTVGVQRQYQLLPLKSVTTNVSQIINLNTLNARNGNTFMVDLRTQWILTGGATFQVRENYVNPSNPGIDIIGSVLSYGVTANQINSGFVFLLFKFDGTHWQYCRLLKAHNESATNGFDVAGIVLSVVDMQQPWINMPLINTDVTFKNTIGAGTTITTASLSIRVYRYKVIGRTVTISFEMVFDSSTGNISGGWAHMRFPVPTGLTPAYNAWAAGRVGVVSTGNWFWSSGIRAIAGDNFITIEPLFIVPGSGSGANVATPAIPEKFTDQLITGQIIYEI